MLYNIGYSFCFYGSITTHWISTLAHFDSYWPHDSRVHLSSCQYSLFTWGYWKLSRKAQNSGGFWLWIWQQALWLHVLFIQSILQLCSPRRSNLGRNLLRYIWVWHYNGLKHVFWAVIRNCISLLELWQKCLSKI